MVARTTIAALTIAFSAISTCVCFADDKASTAAPPKVGDKAGDFSLNSPAGEKVNLHTLLKQGPAVLVVLRGFPGYQCPLCNRQVGELLASADAFAEAGANVVMVYPGPGERLDKRAQEFLGKRSLPKHFSLVVDPDYAFTLAYHLRWDAASETAFPATFVIDRDGVIRFAQISQSHGGRTPAKTMLEQLKMLK